MPRNSLAVLLFALVSATAISQAPAPVPAPAPLHTSAPLVHSPEVSADGKITLRIFAPEAKTVTLIASDTVSLGQKLAEFTRNDQGIWEATTETVPPGAYRYLFNVDGIPTADPRNPSVSPSNATVWSLAVVSGADWVDRRPDVPHGSVSTVYYNSTALSRPRRITVYTPPGYETSTKKYPVLYLLHGSSDSDESWTTVGRANFILDNLLAADKAVPMLIVMPAGHTVLDPVFVPPTPGQTRRNEFVEDFLQDVVPYIASHYRVLTDQPHTAIAGLSMGGGQTIDLLMARPREFAYVGVFSSGIFAGMRRRPAPTPGSGAPQ